MYNVKALEKLLKEKNKKFSTSRSIKDNTKKTWTNGFIIIRYGETLQHEHIDNLIKLYNPEHSEIDKLLTTPTDDLLQFEMTDLQIAYRKDTFVLFHNPLAGFKAVNKKLTDCFTIELSHNVYSTDSKVSVMLVKRNDDIIAGLMPCKVELLDRLHISN